MLIWFWHGLLLLGELSARVPECPCISLVRMSSSKPKISWYYAVSVAGHIDRRSREAHVMSGQLLPPLSKGMAYLLPAAKGAEPLTLALLKWHNTPCAESMWAHLISRWDSGSEDPASPHWLPCCSLCCGQSTVLLEPLPLALWSCGSQPASYS